MPGYAGEPARRLAREADAVCRHYLSNGRREGRYWKIGDVKNTPGRSMFVRLSGPASGKGAAGKWTDCATGEHGDLLDVIGATCALDDFHDVEAEARRFLSLPTAASRAGPEASARIGADRLARIGTATLRNVAPDCTHTCRNVLAQSWHHGSARNRKSALPSALLLSARSL